MTFSRLRTDAAGRGRPVSSPGLFSFQSLMSLTLTPPCPGNRAPVITSKCTSLVTTRRFAPQSSGLCMQSSAGCSAGRTGLCPCGKRACPAACGARASQKAAAALAGKKRIHPFQQRCGLHTICKLSFTYTSVCTSFPGSR